MNTEFDVVTIGSATVDMFADTQSELIRIDTPSHHAAMIAFPLGSKVIIDAMEFQTGGGGTNTATAFARLGLRTAYLGKIGKDGNGAMIKQKLAEEGIAFIGGEGDISGLSVVLNSFANDRTILAYKGTNNQFSPEDVQPFTSRWIYLSSMMGQSLETARQVILQQNCKLAFNPSNYQAKQGYERLQGIVDQVDFLVMNREEANKFFALDYTEQRPIEDLVLRFRELPPSIVAITDGKEGAYVYDREALYFAHPNPDLKVKETTGAGDAFASSFTAALAYNKSTTDALQWAMTNAESVLQYRGAKEKLLSKSELEDEVAKRQHQIEVLATESDLAARTIRN